MNNLSNQRHWKKLHFKVRQEYFAEVIRMNIFYQLRQKIIEYFQQIFLWILQVLLTLKEVSWYYSKIMLSKMPQNIKLTDFEQFSIQLCFINFFQSTKKPHLDGFDPIKSNIEQSIETKTYNVQSKEVKT